MDRIVLEIEQQGTYIKGTLRKIKLTAYKSGSSNV